jgi:hypothetical protein
MKLLRINATLPGMILTENRNPLFVDHAAKTNGAGKSRAVKIG